MAEFKTGDKVRITATPGELEAIWAPRSASGVEGTVVDLTNDGALVKTAERLDGHYAWAYKNEMLEKIDG